MYAPLVPLTLPLIALDGEWEAGSGGRQALPRRRGWAACGVGARLLAGVSGWRAAAAAWLGGGGSKKAMVEKKT